MQPTAGAIYSMEYLLVPKGRLTPSIAAALVLCSYTADGVVQVNPKPCITPGTDSVLGTWQPTPSLYPRGAWLKSIDLAASQPLLGRDLSFPEELEALTLTLTLTLSLTVT